jgi:hypothetical protein
MIPGFIYKISMFSRIKTKHNYTYRLSRSSLVGIRTLLWVSWYGVRIPIEATDFSVLRNVRIGSGTHSASYSTVTGTSSLG